MNGVRTLGFTLRTVALVLRNGCVMHRCTGIVVAAPELKARSIGNENGRCPEK
jgi:hypothetical protein